MKLQTQCWINRIRYASMPIFFSLTQLQDSLIIFQQAQGLSVYTSPCSECTSSLITQTFSNNADCIFFFQPAIRFLHHLPAGSGTTLCTMHLAVHILFFFMVFSTSSSLYLCSVLMTTSLGPLQLALKCVHFAEQDFNFFYLSSLHPYGKPRLRVSLSLTPS